MTIFRAKRFRRNLSKLDLEVDFDHDRDPSRSWPYTIGLKRQVKPRKWKYRSYENCSCAIQRDPVRIFMIQVVPKIRSFQEDFVNIFYEMEI